MAGETQAETQRSRYLLGESSEAERERIEYKYFTDEDAFQEMLTAEDDLIDDYARGELSAEERRQFEQRFLTSSQGSERVQFARTFLGASLGPSPVAKQEVTGTIWSRFFASIPGRTPALRVAMATLAIAVTAGFSGLLIERARMNKELGELRAERARLSQKADELQRTADAERARNAETISQLEDLKRRIPPAQQIDHQLTAQAGSDRQPKQPVKREAAILANNSERRVISQLPQTDLYTLTPGSTRSGGGTTLTRRSNANFITLRLVLETRSTYEAYRASIETADGNPVRSLDWTRPAGVSVLERIDLPPVPATDLRPGDYVLFLQGKQPNGSFERVAEYSFRVVKN